MGEFEYIVAGLGLMAIYLALSLICTGINEILAGIFKRRRRSLLTSLEFILAHNNSSSLVTDFRTHPLIQSLYGKNFQTSYVPPKIFSSVLLDLLHPGDSHTITTLNDIRNTIDPPKGSTNPQISSTLYQTLKLLTKESGNNIKQLKVKIEEWYNEAMVGTSGRYRTRTQAIVLLIAVTVTFAANADTFAILNFFTQDSALRAALVAQTEKLKDATPDAAIPRFTLKDLENTGLHLGWETFPPPSNDFGFKKFMGLLITAIAISLGAPFWFDLLKKVANVRAGSLSPDEVEKEKKKGQGS